MAPMTTARSPLALLATLLMTQALPAQSGGFGYNRLDFHNSGVHPRQDLFPNADTSQGIEAGDGLFKVLPKEILDRGGSAHRVSGYRMVLGVQQSYTGFFPAQVRVPAVELYRTQVLKLGAPSTGTKEYQTLDPKAPLNVSFGSFRIDIPSKQAYELEVRFAPSQQDPDKRALVPVADRVAGQPQGIAIKAVGTVGESVTSGFLPAVVLRPSYQEKHRRPWQDSYSGAFFANSGSPVRMYGMLGMPSRTAELQLSLLFDNPTLSLYGSTAGGLAGSKTETRMGPGAYGTDLASTLGTEDWGMFVQDTRRQAARPSHLAVPLVAGTGAAPQAQLDLLGARLLVDPGAAGLWAAFYELGSWGGLDRIPAENRLGFAAAQEGAWASTAFRLPAQPALVGEVLWLQALVVPLGAGAAEASNLVRVTF